MKKQKQIEKEFEKELISDLLPILQANIELRYYKDTNLFTIQAKNEIILNTISDISNKMNETIITKRKYENISPTFISDYIENNYVKEVNKYLQFIKLGEKYEQEQKKEFQKKLENKVYNEVLQALIDLNNTCKFDKKELTKILESNLILDQLKEFYKNCDINKLYISLIPKLKKEILLLENKKKIQNNGIPLIWKICAFSKGLEKFTKKVFK